jgi:Protein of unknown function (DUF2490)
MPGMKMMMTMIKRAALLLCFSLLALNALPQKKDFGIWYDASAEIEVFRKLEVNISTSVRTFNNAAKIEEAFLEGEVSYKFNKYLAAAASYRLTEFLEKDDSYHIRHKWFADIKGTLPFGNFKLTGRVMFEERYKTYITDDNDDIPASHGRFRLKAFYDFPTLPVDPYMFGEIFCPLFKDSEYVIDKKRIGAGAELTITVHHYIDMEYLFQRDYSPHLYDENILSFGYTFKF